MGLLSINVAPFDIVAAIREVVRTFGTSAQQQEIELRVDRGDSLDRLDVDFIVADAGRLKQVTYNFVSQLPANVPPRRRLPSSFISRRQPR